LKADSGISEKVLLKTAEKGLFQNNSPIVFNKNEFSRIVKQFAQQKEENGLHLFK
jgi:hypothetical protein